MDTLDKAIKDQVYKTIAETLVRAVEENKMADSDLPIVSADILNAVHDAETMDDLIQNLEALNASWPFFDTLIQQLQGEQQQAGTEEQTKKMEQLLKENKVDEALQASAES